MRIPRALLVIFTAQASVSLAQALHDPTRPPPGWLPTDPKVPAAKEAAKAEGIGSEQVQLLLVGKTRRFAIVRGELVDEKAAGTKLVEVKRNDVIVNSSEKGRETLNLFPDVQKTPPRKQDGMGMKDKK